MPFSGAVSWGIVNVLVSLLLLSLDTPFLVPSVPRRARPSWPLVGWGGGAFLSPAREPAEQLLLCLVLWAVRQKGSVKAQSPELLRPLNTPALRIPGQNLQPAVAHGESQFWPHVGSYLVTVQRQTVCRKTRLLVISTMGVAVSWHSSCWVPLAKTVPCVAWAWLWSFRERAWPQLGQWPRSLPWVQPSLGSSSEGESTLCLIPASAGARGWEGPRGSGSPAWGSGF